jgi:hypothetical protein
MKFHNGKRRINKVDGGKKRAKKQYHKKIREADADLEKETQDLSELGSK